MKNFILSMTLLTISISGTLKADVSSMQYEEIPHLKCHILGNKTKEQFRVYTLGAVDNFGGIKLYTSETDHGNINGFHNEVCWDTSRGKNGEIIRKIKTLRKYPTHFTISKFLGIDLNHLASLEIKVVSDENNNVLKASARVISETGKVVKAKKVSCEYLENLAVIKVISLDTQRKLMSSKIQECKNLNYKGIY